MTFTDCLAICLDTPELVAQYNRLARTSIGADTRAPIVRMIDTATGYQEEVAAAQKAELQGFAEFVRATIYEPLFGQPEE